MTLVALAVGPTLLLLHFFYVRDLHERESLTRVLKVFFLGMLSVVPAIILESFYHFPPEAGLLGIAINAFLLVALPEELSKLWLFRMSVEKHRSYNEVYDGIIYMVAISLGFATVENLAYVLGSGQDGLAVALMRAVLAVPGHTLWAVMMGYYLGLSRFGASRANPRLLMYIGLLIAVFWHGLYDFFAFSMEILPESMGFAMLGCCLLVIVVNWVIALVLVSRAQRLSQFRRPSPIQNPLRAFQPGCRYCHNCGSCNPLANNFCNNCGQALRQGSSSV
ncbi:PrsW family intramembrane metalloprotease [bacterium]|nr:PrsW family intramembrane metalloprotease [bacterium]